MQAPLQLNAIGAPHLDVDQRDVESRGCDPRERLVGVFGGADLVAFLGEPFRQGIANAQFVIHDQ